MTIPFERFKVYKTNTQIEIRDLRILYCAVKVTLCAECAVHTINE